MAELQLFAAGIPVPKGSMKAFMRPGMKHPVLTHDNLKSAPWAQSVKWEALRVKQARSWPLAEAGEPLRIDCVFYLPRPKGHYGSGAKSVILKPSAPVHHTTKPDRDKLLRNICDALKGIIYSDDSQLVSGITDKKYADATHPPGATITITILTPAQLSAHPAGATNPMKEK